MRFHHVLLRTLLASISFIGLLFLSTAAHGNHPVDWASEKTSARITDDLWLPPLGKPLRVSHPYSLPNGPFRAGHRGIDIPTSLRTEIQAPAAGIVSFVGTVVDRTLISINIDEQTILSIEPLSSSLAEGDSVTRGQPIGTVTTGGHCESRCLHLGVRINGEYVNPLRFLRQRPILLPR